MFSIKHSTVKLPEFLSFVEQKKRFLTNAIPFSQPYVQFLYHSSVFKLNKINTTVLEVKS